MILKKEISWENINKISCLKGALIFGYRLGKQPGGLTKNNFLQLLDLYNQEKDSVNNNSYYYDNDEDDYEFYEEEIYCEDDNGCYEDDDGYDEDSF